MCREGWGAEGDGGSPPTGSQPLGVGTIAMARGAGGRCWLVGKGSGEGALSRAEGGEGGGSLFRSAWWLRLRRRSVLLLPLEGGASGGCCGGGGAIQVTLSKVVST